MIRQQSLTDDVPSFPYIPVYPVCLCERPSFIANAAACLMLWRHSPGPSVKLPLGLSHHLPHTHTPSLVPIILMSLQGEFLWVDDVPSWKRTEG
jgi:hypothetical protein